MTSLAYGNAPGRHQLPGGPAPKLPVTPPASRTRSPAVVPGAGWIGSAGPAVVHPGRPGLAAGHLVGQPLLAGSGRGHDAGDRLPVVGHRILGALADLAQVGAQGVLQLFDHAVGDVVLARCHGAGGSTAIPGPVRQEPPQLELSETLIEHRDVQPGEELPPDVIQVLNRGAGRLDWTAEADASWIKVERDGDTIKLRFAQQPGTNRGNVHVHDRGGGGMRTIRVVVHVLPHRQPPRLQLSTTLLDFGIINVGAPATIRTVQLFNVGGGVLNGRAWANEPWLRVRQSGDTLNVSIDTAWTGDLRGMIQVLSDGGEGRIQVAARVGHGPVLVVLSDVDFGLVPQRGPAARVVRVRNEGSGTLDWSLSHSGDFFTVRSRPPSAIEVHLHNRRRPGRHTGSFWLRSNGGMPRWPSPRTWLATRPDDTAVEASSWG
jgi:hypothetical protein